MREASRRNGTTWISAAGSLLLAAAAIAGGAGIEKFADLKSFRTTAEEVVKVVGEPAARYADTTHEHWFYDGAVQEKIGRRTCPELLLKGGKYAQTNFLLEETMKKSVAIVKSFGDFRPNPDPRPKRFALADTQLAGAGKADVVAKLGAPDVKRVHDGREIWDYFKVPVPPGEMSVTVHVEFEGEKVSQTTGG